MFSSFIFSTNAQINRSMQNISHKKQNILRDSSQNTTTQNVDSVGLRRFSNAKKLDSIPPIDKYKIFDIKENHTIVDTTLTVKKYFEHNLFKKDLAGFIPFANDGRGGTFADYWLKNEGLFPTLGMATRQITFLKTDDIYYYNVPTPWTRLNFQSGIKQGQQLDAFITLNITEKLNVFTGYTGLRSLGAYINELTSVGNFRIGGSYFSKNNTYKLFSHIVVQDQFLQENGGITEPILYQDRETNREQLDVRLRDASTTLDNTRLYLNHQYAFINKENNKVILSQKIEYNYWKNLYKQPTAFSYNLNESYFGEIFSGIYDKSKLKTLENQVDLSINNSTLGKLTAFVNTYTYNYFFNSQMIGKDNQVIPSRLNNTILSLGGSYLLKTKPLDIDITAQQSISKDNISSLSATTHVKPLEKVDVNASYQFMSKLPNFTSQMYQSNLVSYNWHNAFNNEKIHKLQFDIVSPWLELEAKYQLIHDKVYFSNDATTLDSYNQYNQLITTPKQHTKLINYFAIAATKKWQWKKYSMENLVKFQQVAQSQDIVNVPTIFTRNTFYYSDYFFKKALYLQAGINVRYFTKYHADGYNPVIGDYYVQNISKIGNYPIVDLFVNGKIQTAKLFVGIENLNSIIGKSNHYTAPTYPYKDITFRFGISWDFFN